MEANKKQYSIIKSLCCLLYQPNLRIRTKSNLFTYTYTFNTCILLCYIAFVFKYAQGVKRDSQIASINSITYRLVAVVCSLIVVVLYQIFNLIIQQFWDVLFQSSTFGPCKTEISEKQSSIIPPFFLLWDDMGTASKDDRSLDISSQHV